MPARTGPNRCHPRKGRAANRNRRRRQNNGTPSNANAGNDATGNVANTEGNVAVDVAANNAPEEDMNVAVVAERVVHVDLEGGHAFAGPVVNADRLVDRALVALNPADAPGPAQDPDGDSDDDSIDVEACMNGLSIGERVRLTHRVADRANMPKIQSASISVFVLVLTSCAAIASIRYRQYQQ